MKTTMTLGFCFGVCMLVSAPLTYAEPANEKSHSVSDRAMQIRIDKAGRKINQADIERAKITAATTSTVAATAMPVDSGLARFMRPENSEVQHNADGSMSAQLGMKSLKYLVMSVDENGNRTVTHVSAEGTEQGDAADHAESEEK